MEAGPHRCGAMNSQVPEIEVDRPGSCNAAMLGKATSSAIWWNICGSGESCTGRGVAEARSTRPLSASLNAVADSVAAKLLSKAAMHCNQLAKTSLRAVSVTSDSELP